MMSEWREVKLGQVCEITSSKRIFASEYRATGIPFYRGKEIIEKQKGNPISTQLFISESRYEEIKTKYGCPEAGDILLSSVGTLGVPYVVKNEQFYFKDGNLTWLKNFKDLNSKFLYYWILSPECKHQIDTKCIGSTQKALTIETLLRFNVLLPSLPIQENIVAVLSCLDDKIELNNHINKNLETQAQAIFKSWFVDFEPFQSEEFIVSELGKIPKEWKIATLSGVCSSISRGITPKYAEKSDQIILNQKCIRDHQVSLAPSRYHVPKKVNEKWLQYGDILVNSTGQGTLGRTAQWYHEELNITVDSHVTIVRPQEPNLIYYIGQFIMGKEYEIESMASGSTGQTELSRERLGALKVIIPPSKLLEDFSAIVEPFMKKITINNQETIQLAKLRDTLLPKLMSGEIQIPQEV